MVKIVLISFGILYCILGIACLVDPNGTSATVGFELINASGRCEFATIYGGFELGIGIAMIVTAIVDALRMGGLVFSTIFSLALPIVRIPGLVIYKVESETTYYIALLELIIAIILCVACYKNLDLSSNKLIKKS